MKEVEEMLSLQQFEGWITLNDTIMGGSSKANCCLTAEGLLLEGDVVERDGGFVSCQSPFFEPPMNLTSYKGLKLRVDGDGRTLKFAIACRGGRLGFAEFFHGGVRWVKQIPTNKSGTTEIEIAFSELKPTVRAKPVNYPLSFNASRVSQFQLLHSRFGSPGEMNSGFRSGPIKILLRSISGIL